MNRAIEKLLTENNINAAQAERLSWYAAQKSSKLHLSARYIADMSQAALDTLLNDETFSVVIHPDFPFSVKQLVKQIDAQGYKALLDDQIIEYVFNKRIANIEILNALPELLAEARAAKAAALAAESPDFTADTSTEEPASQTPAEVASATKELSAIQEIEADSENVHNAQLHDSSSQTLLNFQAKYGYKLEGSKIFDELTNIQNWLSSLPADNGMNEVAQAAFTRLTTTSYRCHIDPKSKLTILQSLVLVWLAINDRDNRIDQTAQGFDAAKARLLEILVNIQFRNISDPKQAKPSDTPDPTCPNGTPNKLVYAAYTVCKGVDITYKTLTQATETSKHLVSLYTKKYLARKFHALMDIPADDLSSRRAKLADLKELFKDIRKEDSELLFSKVKKVVAKKIFEEYGCLFEKGQTDADFIAFIDAGQYVDVSAIVNECHAKLSSEIKAYNADSDAHKAAKEEKRSRVRM